MSLLKALRNKKDHTSFGDIREFGSCWEVWEATIPTLFPVTATMNDFISYWNKIGDGYKVVEKLEEYELIEIVVADLNQQYSAIENLIINWSNNGTKTAGELTREIIKLLKDEKEP